MIERVRGRVIATNGSRLVVDVQGFGMELEVTGRVLDRLGSFMAAGSGAEEVTILTRLLVREDDVRLVGFADEEERDAYDHLRMVSGVGPRLALAILSTAGPAALAQGIVSGEVDPILRTPGVGKKLVQRIAVELRDWAVAHADPGIARAAQEASGGAGASGLVGWSSGEQDEAVTALVGLGFSLVEARTAVAAARSGQPADADTATLVRDGLRFLGNGRMEGRVL